MIVDFLVKAYSNLFPLHFLLILLNKINDDEIYFCNNQFLLKID